MRATKATPNAVGRRAVPLVAVTAVAILAGGAWSAWSAWRSADLREKARAAAIRADWDRAAALLGRLAWYSPRDRKILGLRVQAALGRGDPIAAARLLALVPDSSPDAADARLSRGRLLIQAFRLREAEVAFRDCLRIDPSRDEARLALIAILAVQHRARDYEAEAWALHDRGSEPIKALRLLAQAAPAIPPDTFTRTADMGDVLRRCLEADGDDRQTRLALARFERGRGEIDAALRLLEPAIRGPSVDPETWLEWAACLLDEGEAEPLRPRFEHPEPTMRGLGEFWLLRGEWARRLGRDAEALDNYREAIRLDPRSADAYYRLGTALRDAGPEAARCREVARKARELKDVVAGVSDRSRDPGQLAHVGDLCREIGRDREARAWYALALRSDPARPEARRGLASLDAKPAPRPGDPAGVPPR